MGPSDSANGPNSTVLSLLNSVDTNIVLSGFSVDGERSAVEVDVIVVLWRRTGVGAARSVHADKGVLESGTAVNKAAVLLRGQAGELLWRRKVRDEC